MHGSYTHTLTKPDENGSERDEQTIKLTRETQEHELVWHEYRFNQGCDLILLGSHNYGICFTSCHTSAAKTVIYEILLLKHYLSTRRQFGMTFNLASFDIQIKKTLHRHISVMIPKLSCWASVGLKLDHLTPLPQTLASCLLSVSFPSFLRKKFYCCSELATSKMYTCIHVPRVHSCLSCSPNHLK